MSCQQQSTARSGAQQLQEHFPGFLDALKASLPEAECIRLLCNFYKSKHARFPRPSVIFDGLEASLDDRLIRERRDKDVMLCRALATRPKADQREFLELYLIDPVDAWRWSMLPAWQRPIRKGDADDVLIWKFFTMQRLNMEQAASDAPPWPLASQGAQLQQLFGTLNRLSPAGVKRLCLVMSIYGVLLQSHRDVGDVVHAPFVVMRT